MVLLANIIRCLSLWLVINFLVHDCEFGDAAEAHYFDAQWPSSYIGKPKLLNNDRNVRRTSPLREQPMLLLDYGKRQPDELLITNRNGLRKSYSDDMLNTVAGSSDYETSCVKCRRPTDLLGLLALLATGLVGLLIFNDEFSSSTITCGPCPPGPTGPSGATGPTGETGVSGADGVDGTPGTPGVDGPAGLPGPPGPTGLTGERGDTGAVGPQGEPGVEGPTGATGLTGEKGEKGERGPPGRRRKRELLNLRSPISSVHSKSVTQTGTISLKGDDGVMLDGPTWLSMVHELWEQDDSPESIACVQETLCRMNHLAMAAPGQAGWALSLSSLPLSYLLHARHTGGFASYIDAALMGRSGANCTELYSSCPRLRY